MTRIERTRGRMGKVSRKNIKEKVFATALILGGMLSAVYTDDATALVLIMFFAAPLLLTNKRIFTK